jgi:hypothetical protein
MSVRIHGYLRGRRAPSMHGMNLKGPADAGPFVCLVQSIYFDWLVELELVL